MKTILITALFLTCAAGAARADSGEMETPACDHQLVLAVDHATNDAELKVVQQLAQDIGDYDAQSQQIQKLKGPSRDQIQHAQLDGVQAIQSDYNQLKSTNPASAAAVAKACSIDE